MNGAENLIPKSKHDLRAVKNLQDVDPASVMTILDQLLDWTADGNWPVAKPMADFLVLLGEPIVPSLKKILNGDDATQKYFCLDLIVRQLPADLLQDLSPDLERLVENPNPEEVAEGIPELIGEMTSGRM